MTRLESEHASLRALEARLIEYSLRLENLKFLMASKGRLQ